MKRLFQFLVIVLSLLLLMGLEGLVEDLVDYKQYYKATESYLNQIYKDFPVGDVSAETDAYIPYIEAVKMIKEKH